MEPITVANFHTFCRICLRELGVESNNKTQPKEIITIELLKVVTGVSTALEEEHIKQVCQSCCIKVNALYSFRERAIESTGICRMLFAEDIKEDAIPRVKSYCRLCLQRIKCNNILDRYDLKKNNELSLTISKCTGLILNATANSKDLLEDDARFPDLICDKCYTALWNFMDIQTVAKRSEEYIQNLLNENKESIKQKEYSKIFIEQLPIQSVLFDEKDIPKIKIEPIDFELNNTSNNIDNKTSIPNVDVNIEIKQLPEIEDQSELSKKELDELIKITTKDDNFIDIGLPINRENLELSEDEIDQEFEIKFETPDHSTTDEELDKSLEEKPQETIKTKKKYEKGKKQLNCKHCGKNFRNKVHFEGHVKGAHEGIENPFDCQFCENSHFPDYNSLQRHITRKHKTKSKETWDGNIFNPPKKSSIHICLQCNRQFTRKSHLQEHMNSVHLSEEERPFKCQFCQKSFGAKKTLERHEKNHSTEKPFACEFCPKRYNLKADFNAHMQRHTCEDASLLCPICKRVKKTQEELQAHIQMHELSRKHQCTTCGKIFTKLFHLKEHETTVHLKLRPFKCSICEKTFATQRSQKEHEQLHDPNAKKSVLCPQCNMGFISRKQLSYHTAKEHKEKVPRKRKAKKTKETPEASKASFPLEWIS